MSKPKTLASGAQLGDDPRRGATIEEAAGLLQVLEEGSDLIPAKNPEGMCNVLTLAMGIVLAMPGFETAKDYDWNVPIQRALALVEDLKAASATPPGEKH